MSKPTSLKRKPSRVSRPVNLTFLEDISHLRISRKERDGFSEDNLFNTPFQYIITDTNHACLYLAGGKSKFSCSIFKCFECEPFKIIILDNTFQVVLKLERYSNEIQVFNVFDKLFGTVKQDSYSKTVTFSVSNRFNEEKMKIIGPSPELMVGAVRLDILQVTPVEAKFGEIMAQLPQSEIKTDGDNTYNISFPEELESHFKAVLMGTVILIDFIFGKPYKSKKK